MRGFIDLHCHWIWGIDDGARTPDASLAMLRGLHQAGFSTVVATPHMRPGMFDNDRAALEQAYARMQPILTGAPASAPTDAARDLPRVMLSSEHFLDDTVYDRLMHDQALPYPRENATELPKRRGVLVEWSPTAFPRALPQRLVDLRTAGFFAVIAHPERYTPVWNDDRCLEPLFDAGARLLLDVCAVVGKYGRAAQRAAEKLLEEEAYEAACSDAHRPEDVPEVHSAIERLEHLVGREEANRLLVDGPRSILAGDKS